MASAKELREMISGNRQALVEAIEAAADRWDGSGDTGMRAVAASVLRAEAERASQAAAILGGNPVASQDWPLASAAEAAATLRKLGAEVDKRFSWAEDRDLSKGQGGVTLEQVMQSHAAALGEAITRVKG